MSEVTGPPAELLAELVHDLGDLYDFDAGGGWWWAVLRAAPGYVIKAQCPRELRAMVEEDHEARVGRRVP